MTRRCAFCQFLFAPARRRRPLVAPPASTWITTKPTAEEERNPARATQLLKDVYQYGHVELVDASSPGIYSAQSDCSGRREGLKQFISHKPHLAVQTSGHLCSKGIKVIKVGWFKRQTYLTCASSHLQKGSIYGNH